MKPGINPTNFVFVPIPVESYAELLRRSDDADVSDWIELAVQNFLERTEGNPEIWSAEYIEKHAEGEDEAFRKKYGDPSRGYQWQTVFLPNGTQFRMTYGGEDSYSEIRHGRFFYDDASMSPSRFARKVANDTSRNAWRDLYVKFPGDGSWKLAAYLRAQGF